MRTLQGRRMIILCVVFVICILTLQIRRKRAKQQVEMASNYLHQMKSLKQPEVILYRNNKSSVPMESTWGGEDKSKNSVAKDQQTNRSYVLREQLETYNPLTLETPLPYLQNYRNPCFRDEYSKLYCLPYFFILSAQKCGTTDLFKKIVTHRMISAKKKEFHWWNRARLMAIPKHPRINMSRYMDMYKKSTQMIEEVTVHEEGEPYHPLVLGDGSASSLYDQLAWRKIPENAGLTQPAIISAHVIRHVLPDAKFLVILRNPTSRLYSDYTYFSARIKRATDSKEFHLKVKQAILWYKDCLANKVQKGGYCLYDIPEYVNTSDPSWHPALSWDPVIRLRAGLYSECLTDWFNVFPREQFYIFTLEDFSRDEVTHLEQMYNFLQLEPASAKELTQYLHSHTLKTNPSYKVPFLNETRQLLDSFYRPYNLKLSKMLDTNRTLWDNP